MLELEGASEKDTIDVLQIALEYFISITINIRSKGLCTVHDFYHLCIHLK